MIWTCSCFQIWICIGYSRFLTFSPSLEWNAAAWERGDETAAWGGVEWTQRTDWCSDCRNTSSEGRKHYYPGTEPPSPSEWLVRMPSCVANVCWDALLYVREILIINRKKMTKLNEESDSDNSRHGGGEGMFGKSTFYLPVSCLTLKPEKMIVPLNWALLYQCKGLSICFHTSILLTLLEQQSRLDIINFSFFQFAMEVDCSTVTFGNEGIKLH